MSEEIEVPLEAAQEHLHHHAEHARETWVSQVALSSAIFAVLAAVAALFAGAHSNDAVLAQIQAANKWSYFQSKGIKSDVILAKIDMLKSLDKPVPEKDRERAEKLVNDKDGAEKEARALEAKSEVHLQTHETLARAVTFFQVTIAIGAVAVLTKRRRFFFVSLMFAAVGLVFFVWGFSRHLSTHETPAAESSSATHG
jgi:hypothetical protein